MSVPTQAELAQRIRGLPAAKPLLAGPGASLGLYLVGGAVRDLLLGGCPIDLDLVYEGDIAELREGLGGRVVTHDRFGTATISAGGFVYDIARARRERYPAPGALPEVDPASLEEDLHRRDFTVNAMAVSLWSRALGELHCAPGATDDLARRLLRVLHHRSFLDDPTRLLRMARYRARLGFEIEEDTRALAQSAIATRALATVSGPRIGGELRLLARERDPVRALRTLEELKLDAQIAPGFGLRDDLIAERALELLPGDGRRDLVVLAAAALPVPAPELARMLDWLAFEAADRDRILAAASEARALARSLGAARRPSEIALAIGSATPEVVALAGALGAQAQARQWLERLSSIGLEIGGADLLAAGVPEGPAVGRGLQAALLAKLDDQAPDRAAELRIALAASSRSRPG